MDGVKWGHSRRESLKSQEGTLLGGDDLHSRRSRIDRATILLCQSLLEISAPPLSD